MCHHVDGYGHKVDITGSLAVSEKSSLDSVGTCQNTELGIGNTGTSVVVGMNGYDYALTVLEVIGHEFDLVCKNMGHCNLYGGRKVDDRLLFRSGLPYVKNRIADLKCKFGLSL